MTDNLYPEAKYDIWLLGSTGVRLLFLDFALSFSYTRALGAVGRSSIALPLDKVSKTYLKPDNLVQFWRNGVLEFMGFIRGIEYYDKQGIDYVTLTGEDGLSLLKSRIVAYRSGSSQASHSGSADIFKKIVRDNLGTTATDTTRDLTSYNFLVDPDANTDNFSMVKKFAYRNVLAVLNDIMAYSFYLATSIGNPSLTAFFDVQPLQLDENTIGWRFYTKRGQLGVNRSTERPLLPNPAVAVSADPTIFSKEQGNLENPRLFYDYSGEINSVYAGGEGEAADRKLGTATDAARIGLSPWNRRERFINYSNQESATALTDRAKQGVAEGRPKIKFSANLKDTADTQYGMHWNYGDKVVCKYRDLAFDAIISALGISVGEDQKEQISARVEVFI